MGLNGILSVVILILFAFYFPFRLESGRTPEAAIGIYMDNSLYNKYDINIVFMYLDLTHGSLLASSPGD